MHEIARELSAQLDSKMRALQSLIAEADRAAARLESATAEASPTTRQPPPPPADPALRPLPSEPSAERCHDEIYALADYGFSAADIANRVGSPIGEVELILGLRERK